MKTIFKISILFVMASLFSCQKNHLENYLVQATENPDFLSVNLPVNFVNFDEEKLDPQTRKDIKAIKKLNILLYKNDYPADKKEKEFKKLQNIIYGEPYKELIKIKNKGYKIDFIYEGNPEKIDKFIFLGKDKNNNFMLGLLKAKGVNANNIYKALQHIKSVNNSEAKKAIEIFKMKEN